MANATPLTIAESVIGFKATPNSAGIAPILKSLSSNAAHNARCLVGVQNELEGLRETITRLEERLNRQHASSVDLGRTMESKFAAQATVIDAVAERSATKAELRQEAAKLWHDVNVATTFVKQVESNSCDSLVQFTRQYIEKFLPIWYEETSQGTLDVVRKIVHEAQEQTHLLMDERVSESDARSAAAAINVQNVTFHAMCQMNDERRRDIHRQRAEIDENMRQAVADIDKAMYEHNLQLQQNHREATARLVQLEESSRALRSTLCIEDSLARELHNQFVQRTKQHPNFLVASLNSDTILIDAAPVDGHGGHMDDEQDDVVNPTSSSGDPHGLDGSTNFHASASGSTSSALRPPRKSRRTVHATEKEVHTLELCKSDPFENINDQRVVRVAQSPHFFALRASLTRDVAERSELIRADLHSDMITEIFDLQREMKGKVGTSKIGELLVQHRDQQLYTNVKNLLSDVGEIRSSKVDHTTFLESLRSKVDHRTIEGKADKSLLITQNEQMLTKVEELAKNLQRLDGRLQNNEISLANVSSRLTQGVSAVGGRGGLSASSDINPLQHSRRLSQVLTYKPPFDLSEDPAEGANGNVGGSARRQSHAELLVERMTGENEVVTDRRGLTKDFVMLFEREQSERNGDGQPQLVVSGSGVDRPASQEVGKRTGLASAKGTPSTARPTSKQQQQRMTSAQPAGGPASGKTSPRQTSGHSNSKPLPPRPTSRQPLSTSPRPTSPTTAAAAESCSGPGLIPLTRFQQAYCEALETDPVQTAQLFQKAALDAFTSHLHPRREHAPEGDS